jgi:hypothetical protein
MVKIDGGEPRIQFLALSLPKDVSIYRIFAMAILL